MGNPSAPQTAVDLSSQGKQAFQSEDYPKAIQCFQTARRLYEEVGELTSAAEESNNLSVAYLKAGDAKASLEAAAETDRVFSQAGDIRRQGYALGNQASALETLGNKKEALERYEHCADLLERIGDRDMLPHVKKAISRLKLAKGDAVGTMIAMQEALKDEKKPSFIDRVLKKMFSWLNRIILRG